MDPGSPRPSRLAPPSCTRLPRWAVALDGSTPVRVRRLGEIKGLAAPQPSSGASRSGSRVQRWAEGRPRPGGRDKRVGYRGAVAPRPRVPRQFMNTRSSRPRRSVSAAAGLAPLSLTPPADALHLATQRLRSHCRAPTAALAGSRTTREDRRSCWRGSARPTAALEPPNANRHLVCQPVDLLHRTRRQDPLRRSPGESGRRREGDRRTTSATRRPAPRPALRQGPASGPREQCRHGGPQPRLDPSVSRRSARMSASTGQKPRGRGCVTPGRPQTG